jgi:hypothetical protein
MMFFECNKCTDTAYRRGVRKLVDALGDGLAAQLLHANEQQRMVIIRTFIGV